MKILIIPSSKAGFTPEKENHILLHHSYWDDYGTKSTYDVSIYLKDKPQYEKIGEAKIISVNASDYDDSGSLTLSGTFEQLPDDFGFLGQSEDFYHSITKALDKDTITILEKLNDLSILPGLRDTFESSYKFKTSLIRYSDAERALKLGRYIVNKESYVDSFSFEFNNGDEAYNTSCFFDFDSRIPIKSRINVIIGENGTGKTTYLADLALSLSGRKNKGEFTEHRPSFSKVISASFSAFDTFEIPAEKKTFSYKYCGLRNKDGFMNRKNMLSVYKSCCKKISERHAIDLWLDTLNNFIPDDKLNYIKEEFFERKIFSNIIDNKLLSSGESILLYSFTQIIAETKKESILLFDEPELHLHPRAISHLIPAIKNILINLNAYAIIATHSPIVLQQVPSKFIRVFDNNSGKVNSRVLEIETLGESLSSITNEVFNTFEINQPYKELLKALFKNNSIEEINDLFEGKLSLSCELYLESLRNNEK